VASDLVSPSGLLETSLVSAGRESSVHYLSVGAGGNIKETQVGDAGVRVGIQHITIHKGTKSGQVTIIVSTGGAYVRGDAFALVSYMGFKTAGAAKYAGKWILVPPSNPDYAPFAAGVTLPSVIRELRLGAPLSAVSATKIDGVPVVGVHGKLLAVTAHSVAGTLYTEATGAKLPVEEVAQQGTTKTSFTLSKWGEQLHIAAPRGATAISATGLQ
jgi:hypothetical protein